MRDARATMVWAFSAIAWGVGLFIGLLLTGVGSVALLIGSETPVVIAIGTTMYLAPFVVLIAVVVALPVTMLLLGLWVTLARRGMVDDRSRTGLGVTAIITAVHAGFVFLWTSGAIEEPFTRATLLTFVLLVTVVTAALLLPRWTVLGLELGRFRPPD